MSHDGIVRDRAEVPATGKARRALEIIAGVCGGEAGDLRSDHHLLVDLGIDSPKAIDLLIRLERELEISISDEEAAAMETVGDVLAFVGDR